MKLLKKIVGEVVSTAMDKTAVIRVTRLAMHPKYRIWMRKRKKYYAHDEHNICGVGDRVQIKDARATSKKKRWVVIDMIRRQPRLEGEPFEMSQLVQPKSDAEQKAFFAAVSAAKKAEQQHSTGTDSSLSSGGPPEGSQASTSAAATSSFLTQPQDKGGRMWFHRTATKSFRKTEEFGDVSWGDSPETPQRR